MIAAVFILGVLIYVAGMRLQHPVQVWLGILWLALVWLLTFISHQNSGFVSPDEIFFSTIELRSIFDNRSLWILINKFVGLTTDEVIYTMRILNFGFVVLFFIAATVAFRTFSPLLLAVAFSYIASVAALNVRDIAILFGTILLIVALGRSQSTIRGVIELCLERKFLVLFVFLLRPFMVLMLLASKLKLKYLALALASVAIFLQTPLGERYFYNYAYYAQNFDEGIASRAEEKEVERREPTPANIVYWSARFAFAPTPWSSAERWISEPETYVYGQVDLTFRTLNRFVIYLLMIAMLTYGFRYPRLTRLYLIDKSFVVKFALLFTFIYALFNFGFSHERIKLVFAILLVYLVNGIRTELAQAKTAGHAYIPYSHKLARL